MYLSINHTTQYIYDENLYGLFQATKLTPTPYNGLKIKSWKVTKNFETGGEKYLDAEGNVIVNFQTDCNTKIVKFIVTGKVETFDTNGIYKNTYDKINPLVYLRSTKLTEFNNDIYYLAKEAESNSRKNSPIEIAHNILTCVANRIEYVPYTTNNNTTAAMAFAQKKGVCQDQAHIMIAAAKSIGIPARYVSGYMHKNLNDSEFQATHAWAELYIEDLGWVGFDPTNQCCPDERYIRVSCGLDASYAAPIRGVFFGNGNEKLEITVNTSELSSQQ